MGRTGKIGAPCEYEFYEEKKQKNVTSWPAVDCDYDCLHCGWNPEEAKRRMKEGYFTYSNVRKNAETSGMIILENPVRSLHFSRS